MNIDKTRIVEMLERGEQDLAVQADAGPPEQVDIVRDAGRLIRLGIVPGQPTGGSGAGERSEG